MELEPSSPAPVSDPVISSDLARDAGFSVSSAPIVAPSEGDYRLSDTIDLPRTYGCETLCLMSRDPHTLFAYWDIDWAAALGEETPKQRAIHLRILDPAGAEIVRVEIEPMAGNVYVTVPQGDTAYFGEIGYFAPPNTWNRLARSEVIATPADSLADSDEIDFATVPFHLSFQHMIDLLRISKQENESLTSMLSDLRTRFARAESAAELTIDERELARVLNEAAASLPEKSAAPAAADFWTQRRVEQLLGIGGATSPGNQSFGGSSRA